jgi:hypothetical protein
MPFQFRLRKEKNSDLDYCPQYFCGLHAGHIRVDMTRIACMVMDEDLLCVVVVSV